MSDQKTVSNEFHELEHVAKKFGIDPSDVVKAKEATGSNKRDVIEAQIMTSRHARNFIAIQHAHDISIQNGNYNASPYMLGMANGLILALSVLQGVEPNYLNAPVDGFLEDRKQPSFEEKRDAYLSTLGDPSKKEDPDGKV